MIDSRRLDRWLLLTLAFGLAAAALFAAAPGLDLAVSGLFYDPSGGFALRRDRWLEGVRQAIWSFSEGLFAALLLVLAASVAAPLRRRLSPRLVTPREAGAGALAFLIGPALLANGLFKAHWGRARPRDVEAFGGALLHSGPLAISDQCARNCSFVSGEAMAAATAALVLGLIALPRLPARARGWAAAALVSVAAAAGALRIAVGAHFLSDVLFAWALAAAVTLGCWRLLAPRGAAPVRS